jgi:hypothetical protein
MAREIFCLTPDMAFQQGHDRGGEHFLGKVFPVCKLEHRTIDFGETGSPVRKRF